MIIEKFILPSQDDELDWKLSGGATIGMPSPSQSILPFGVFPQRALGKVDLRNITVLSGGSNTEKLLLARIIISKLGEDKLPAGMDKRCLEDYLGLCAVKYADISKRDTLKVVHITDKEREAFLERRYADFDTDRNWSAVCLYDELIAQDSFVIIEDPEIGMSLTELKEFAAYVEEMSRHRGCQFIILTNSPIIMGLRHAIIYDFDKTPIIPNTWYYSSVANEHTKFYEELYNDHHTSKMELNH